MCGIAGFITNSSKGLQDGIVPKACRMLQHRGPDDYGFFSLRNNEKYLGRDFSREVPGANALLIHQRLAILDLSDAGHQPMQSSDGRFTITYNGEIYNYIELRRELELLGHVFNGRSDTEVILAAFSEWGEEALPRFIGMFAFAILDIERQRLFLARDFFGIKPLFYSSNASNFGFASEIKVLLECMDIRRTANPERVYHYLRYGMSDHGESTMFQSVRQLAPAHFMWIDLRTLSMSAPECYWEPSQERNNEVSFTDAVGYVRQEFLQNINLHLRSDVPVGAALSGGIDSSSIVMAMRYVGGADANINAFSFIPDDRSISEEKWIDEVVSQSGCSIQKVRPNAQTLVGDLNRITRIHDEPIGGISAIPQNYVFKAAHESGIKVMLDGQGADEILGGYRLFVGARLGTLIRQKRFFQAAVFLSRAAKLPGCSHFKVIIHMLECLLPISMQEPLRRIIGKETEPDWLNQSWFRGNKITPFLRTYTDKREVLHSQLLRAVKNGLPRLLRFEDRNSMNFSIESRVPFLVPSFVNYLLSLPEEYLISPNGVRKSVFREAMRGIVPDNILDRKDKAGFPTPGAKWLATVNEWVKETLKEDSAYAIPAFSRKKISDEWEQILSGKRSFNLSVWRCLNLITWTKLYNTQYN